ncbi:MAG TPA: ankyrin repeat domain-containing protein [Candidatus Paenibacillus intestinavium]|nr:ankyrin repeat domain-containing protein [Candidatus Paenibacillus intestinavium]
MIKRVLFLLVIFFFQLNSLINATEPNARSVTYNIVIDNKELMLTTQAYIQNGVTMIPFRPFFNQLGFNVEWDSKNNQVIGKNADKTIKLTIGSVNAKVNDNIEVMPIAPTIKNGTTFIPLRFVGTASGGSVELYGGSLNVIWITSAKQNQLLDAVLNKNIVEVTGLLKSGADPTVMVGPVGPAIYSFVDNSVDIVKLFLESGMDVNYYSEGLNPVYTLLQHAASEGHVEVVKFLLLTGANPLLTAGKTWTALELAEYWKVKVENGYLNIIDPLNTPSVESYDEIIKLLSVATNSDVDDSSNKITITQNDI